MRVIDRSWRHVLGAADLDDLRARARAIEAWPAGSHVWGTTPRDPHGADLPHRERLRA
jgi:hypothetical protein